MANAPKGTAMLKIKAAAKVIFTKVDIIRYLLIDLI